MNLIKTVLRFNKKAKLNKKFAGYKTIKRPAISLYFLK